MKDVLSGGLEKEEICFGKTSLRRQDYRKYCWKKGEFGATVVLSAAVTALLSCFFYRSVWAVPFLAPVGVACFLRIYSGKGKRAREELATQFRECILAATASLQAGYSVENAFLECEQDMLLMYGREAFISRELRLIRRGLRINISLEELLSDLGVRSGCEEILQFSEVFSIAKRNGGNMTEIIGSTAELMGRKTELRREMHTLLSGKKMELAIMEVMPFAILVYIGIATPGYFDSLYHRFPGILVMTGCLTAYLGAFAMGEWIIKHMEKGLG